ncbi:MAG: 30S ribosomal protein S16 [Candidatus Dependentiae bacterium]|nr:30S ribosomal protein S16 [Candidatus Dependentiae bacterium]
MAVKVRLARVGKKHAPFYRIVAIDSRNARDGATLEILGTYNPTKGEFVQFHQERLDYWLGNGAELTEAVRRLQKKHKEQHVVAAA